MYSIGTAKKQLQVFFPNIGMMGYGMPHHKAKGEETPLFVRAYAFKDEAGSKFVFVNSETTFITLAMKTGVIKALTTQYAHLGYTDANVMLTAQHSHSTPGGYSHYAIYNVSIPGFRPQLLQNCIDTLVEAIVAADANLAPATLHYAEGEFGADKDVGFNRSLTAYNQNPDVEQLTPQQTHLAMERTMHLLRINDSNGKPLGSFNFFGVHTTSLPNNRYLINADNKGYAATYMEEALDNSVVCAFAQEAAGDISPNYHGKGKTWKRGPYADPLKSCQFNGNLQFEKAMELFAQAETSPALTGNIDCELVYANLGDTTCNPKFVVDCATDKTSPSIMGLAFIKGTPIDGKGIPNGLARITSHIIKESVKRLKRRAKMQGPQAVANLERILAAQAEKEIVIETGDRRVLSSANLSKFFLPSIADPLIGELKRQYKAGSLREHSWAPQIVPMQIAVVGSIAFVGFPGEITTVAYRRLKAMLQGILAKRGVTQVIVASYANCYFGYCTTPQEYAMQCYEGGHTTYGKNTLAAFLTHYENLAEQLLKSKGDRTIDTQTQPPVFSERELSLRTHQQG